MSSDIRTRSSEKAHCFRVAYTK